MKKKPFLNRQQVSVLLMVLGIAGFAFLTSDILRGLSVVVFAVGAISMFSR